MSAKPPALPNEAQVEYLCGMRCQDGDDHGGTAIRISARLDPSDSVLGQLSFQSGAFGQRCSRFEYAENQRARAL